MKSEVGIQQAELMTVAHLCLKGWVGAETGRSHPLSLTFHGPCRVP